MWYFAHMICRNVYDLSIGRLALSIKNVISMFTASFSPFDFSWHCRHAGNVLVYSWSEIKLAGMRSKGDYVLMFDRNLWEWGKAKPVYSNKAGDFGFCLELDSAGHIVNSGDREQWYHGEIVTQAKICTTPHDWFLVKRQTILGIDFHVFNWLYQNSWNHRLWP